MSDVSIFTIDGARSVNQYVNTADDTIRYRTRAAARRANADGAVVQMSDGGSVPNVRTLRRFVTDVATMTPRAIGDRPVVADVTLHRLMFGHRVARGADWSGSRPNSDEQRLASGGRTTDAARAAFVAMLSDTAARLDVTTDALRAWMATDGATRNVPTDDVLTAMRSAAPTADVPTDDAPDA
jgi:hypothetical protein